MRLPKLAVTNIHANTTHQRPTWRYHHTMQVSVQSNIREILPKLDRFTSKQAPFAIALALTNTAMAVRKQMNLETTKVFDRPSAFTRRAFLFKKADRVTLTAYVFAKDKQAKYLKAQVQGGGRRVKGFEKRFAADGGQDSGVRGQALVPTDKIKRDRYGNVSLSQIKRITADMNTKGSAGRYFIGKPKGGGKNGGRGHGIYARVNNNTRIEALMVFASTPQYKKRFDMTAIGRRVVSETFEQNLRNAWARALATAR